MTRASRPTESAPKSKPGFLVGVLSFIFRLLLLGVGGGLAWCVGMAIAQVYPDTRSEPPLAERLLRQWRGEAGPVPSEVVPAPPPTPEVPTPAPQSLTPERRQALRLQLQQLQQDLNTLIGRTAALESSMGNSRPAEPLERRLQIVEQQLEDPAPTPTPSPPPSPSRSPDGLMMTLPGDILFTPGSGALRPGANVILDNLIPDIQSYPGATVRVGGHVGDAGNRQQNLDLSLQQAEAVVNYLSEAVDSQGYHWVAIGYGSTRPTAENTSDTSRQLNRRVEVAISPLGGINN